MTFWLSALLMGCGGEFDAETFLDRYAKATCIALEECERAYFLELYGDRSECREEIVDALEDVLEDDSCTFEPEEAQRCLDSFQEYEKTCDYRDLKGDDCADAFGCERDTTTPSTRYTTYYGYGT